MTEVVRDEQGRVEFTPSGKLVEHGKASSYNNHGCRCLECKAAWATYMYPRLKAHRAKKRKAKTSTPKVQINL